MKLRNVVVALSAVLIGTAAPGFAQAARVGGGGHTGGSHFSGGHSGGGHWSGGSGGYRGHGGYSRGYSGFGVGLGIGLLGAAIAAPYYAAPYYPQPYYAPAYPPAYPPAGYAPYGSGYGAYDGYPGYADPRASGYGYEEMGPTDPRY